MCISLNVLFATSAVEFLGHKLTSQGTQIGQAHSRRSETEIEHTGRITIVLRKNNLLQLFYSRSINRFLRDMLVNKPFKWTSAAKKAYDAIKSILILPQVLMLYDPARPLLLATNASKTRLSAVLSHKLNNGQERPIAYASRTLSTTEQGYPQIDKEVSNSLDCSKIILLLICPSIHNYNGS